MSHDQPNAHARLDAPAAGDVASARSLRGVRKGARRRKAPVSMVSLEPAGTGASVPVSETGRADPFVYICHLTEAEVRAVARREISDTLVAYCEDARQAFDETPAEGVQRRRRETR